MTKLYSLYNNLDSFPVCLDFEIDQIEKKNNISLNEVRLINKTFYNNLEHPFKFFLPLAHFYIPFHVLIA